MPHVHPRCFIVPPHLLREIARRGEPAERDRALHAIAGSSHLRGRREALAPVTPFGALPTGGRRRTVYDARHTTELPGHLVRSEADPAVADIGVNEAFDGCGATWSFYQSVCGRTSIDGRGMRLDATVHFDHEFNNAFWDGRQMVYGDGDGRIFTRFTAHLDVIAHELTHGVTSCTAGLVYHDQPGALNESFSDVFGVLVAQHARRQSAAAADWLVGAGLFAPGIHAVAIRSLRAPGTAYDDPRLGRDPQPAHMRQFVHTVNDNGGVHINSGIPNHAFFLIAQNLGGFAWEKAGLIWYDALTAYLRPTADFSAAAHATHLAATLRFGRGSLEARAVADGWRAVGVDADVSAPRRPRVPATARAPRAAAHDRSAAHP